MGPIRPCEPPDDAPEFIEVITPPVRRKIIFLARPTGFQTHWVGSATKPCLEELPSGCPAEWHATARKWVGYAPALLPAVDAGRDGSARVVLAKAVIILSRRLHAALEREAGGRGADWRGLQVEREDAVRWKPGERLTGPRLDALPPAFDFERVLYRLWGVEHLLRAAAEQRPAPTHPPVIGKIG